MLWYETWTLAVITQVPRVYAENRWAWGDDRMLVPAHEHVYSARDLHQVMLTYGRWVAYLLQATGPPRYRLLGKWRSSNTVIASYTWHWDAYLGQYWPTEEPWCVWELAHAS